MEKFGRSQPVRRVEDVRFLTGAGGYIDDIAPADALAAQFLRSAVAHGRIAALDVSAARAAPGVHLVLTCADLEAAGLDIHIRASRITNRDGSRGARTLRPMLARDRVRFVGEPVALVVAETVAQARDAAELIELEIDDLDPHVAVAPGGPELHDTAPGNLAFDFALGDAAAVDAALARAARVTTCVVEDNRIIVNSLEPRGVTARMEDGRLHVAVNGQGVWQPKKDLVRYLRMDAAKVRVTNPDTGGGFGMKGCSYPEMFAVAQAARTLGRPVHWMSDRSEAMQSDNAGRDLVSTATMGFDADHRLIAYKVDTVANMGAYNSQFAQEIQTDLFARVLPGVYDVQTVAMTCKGVYTNTAPVDAYRGAGRPEAIFVLERAMDHAARELGIDPWALRRRNFIPADAFPYLSATGMTYDVGDFHMVLDRVRAEADVAGFPARRAAAAARGRLRGLGLCYYIESILGDPDETAKIVFEEGGAVALHVGTQSTGQGHETVFASFLSDHTGIPADAIRVVQGDSDVIPHGGGTGGSRSATVQSTATLATVEAMIAAFIPFLADTLEVPVDDIGFDGERFRAKGSNRQPTLREAAEMAREAGRDDLLAHSRTIVLENRSFPNGAHVAEVEIDPETGVLRVERYTVVDDFGNLLNPMLVEGQIHGGVAQGIGQAVTERAVYDETGQLLTASFMDYAMPRADDVPMISFTSTPVPSLYNPLGMKGCGEAGTVGALAAVANAVHDAVAELGITGLQMPFTPLRLWQAMQKGRRGAA